MTTSLACDACQAPEVEIIGAVVVDGSNDFVESIGYGRVCGDCGHRDIDVVMLWMHSDEPIERP